MQVRWFVPVAIAATQVVQVAYAAQYMTVEQSQRSAFADATEFRAVAMPDVAAVQAVGGPAGWAAQIFNARAADKNLGWLIVDRVIGKSELITYALAIDANGAVKALEILDYRESHGSEIHLAGWRNQFVGKTVADPMMLNQDIRNISGATLSCRHVTEGVQRLLKLYNVALRPLSGAA